MLATIKIRMFDIHEDIWLLGFPFILYIIPIYLNMVLTFEIESKQGNVENVDRFKNEGFIFYWIFVVNGSISCCCTKYAKLFLLDPQHSL